MNKKNKRKLVGVFIFALVVFSMFGFVSAAESSTLYNVLQKNAFFKPLLDLFGFTSSEGFAAVLLGILVVMMVYSLISFVPFFGESQGIKWAASIIIGILAFFYIKVDTIVALLGTYESLGIVLSVAIPFLIVLGFSIRLETNKNTKNYVFSYILSNLVVWGFVVLVAVSLVSSAVVRGEGGSESSAFTFRWENLSLFRAVYILFLIVGIVWAISKKKIIGRAELEELESISKEYNRLLKVQNIKAVEDSAAVEDAVKQKNEKSS